MKSRSGKLTAIILTIALTVCVLLPQAAFANTAASETSKQPVEQNAFWEDTKYDTPAVLGATSQAFGQGVAAAGVISTYSVAPTGVVDADKLQQGDIVKFGEYAQSDTTGVIKDPIEWIVLSNDGDKLFLFSKYILDGMIYNNQGTGGDKTRWDDNLVEPWLNGDFLKSAFSSNEQAAISTTTIKNEVNPAFPNWYPGDPVDDKVFLLSYLDATNTSYGFDSDINAGSYVNNIRAAEATAYAFSDHGTMGGRTMGHVVKYFDGYDDAPYWLRTRGSTRYAALAIGPGGTFVMQMMGWTCDTEASAQAVKAGWFGVRPALNLDLSKVVIVSDTDDSPYTAIPKASLAPTKITKESLIAGTIGVDYEDELEPLSDDNGYTYDERLGITVTVDGLPAGLEYDPDTHKITGVPLAYGAFEVTVTATNDWGTVDETFSLTIADKKFTVLFLDWDDRVIQESKVSWGANATAPANPTRAGYTFAKWDKDVSEWSNVKEEVTVKAIYTQNPPPTFIVRFLDWNGDVLSTQNVNQGEDAVAPADPVRAGYTFINWDKDFTNVQASIDVKALYSLNQTSPDTFTVRFLDWDGTVLDSQTVTQGDDASAPEDPTRAGYTFTGWDKDFTNVQESIDVTALYEENQPVTFTVRFLDWNGDVLSTQNVNQGEDAVAPANPVRSGYTFTGWDKEFTNVQESIDVTALYTLNQTPPTTFTVRFLDWNGNVLKTQIVERGANATPPASPTREGYTFSGWSGSYTNVQADVDVTATYTLITVGGDFTVRFLDWNGTVLKTQIVERGANATPPANPTREGYTFAGWSGSYTNVQADVDVTATYTLITTGGTPATDDTTTTGGGTTTTTGGGVTPAGGGTVFVPAVTDVGDANLPESAQQTTPPTTTTPQTTTPGSGGGTTTPETIVDPQTPLSSGDSGASDRSWALLDLICALVAVIAALAGIIIFVAKRSQYAKKAPFVAVSAIAAVAAVVIFFLTQDISLPMAMIDSWTLPLAIIAIISVVTAALAIAKPQRDTGFGATPTAA
jgi:uncharacterized repeat protein (TIGR02543 family)